MRIIAGKVDWYQEYANRPQLRLFVDEIPNRDDMVYTKKDGLYFSELDGLVSFFSYDRPGQGFSGSGYTLDMDDGTIVVLSGPWSSRAGCMNGAGFTPCLDVSLTDDERAWAKGYTFLSSTVTKELVDEARDRIEIGEYFVRSWNGKERGDRFYFPPGSKFTLVSRNRKSRGTDMSAQQSNSMPSSGDEETVYEPAVELYGGEIWTKE